MNDQKQILEQYLQAKFSDKTSLTISRFDKLRDGWESDNYIITIEYGEPRTHVDWVLRIYSGRGSYEKATREFNSMQNLFTAGYPVPRVFLLEAEHSPIGRPFILMEYIPGEMMWQILDVAPADRQAQLIEQFSRLFVQLHELDWKQFDDSLPSNNQFFFIDRWLKDAHSELQMFPDIDASSFLDWVAARRSLFGCTRPSPVHQDFHPGNVLVKVDDSAIVIDWTGFEITDSRFDLAWTLVLTHAHGRPGLRDQIFDSYQRHAANPVEQCDVFEAIACARRLFGVAVSLTQGAKTMGMNEQAVESMRAYMGAHRRVYHLFIQLTGLQIKTFDELFGESE